MRSLVNSTICLTLVIGASSAFAQDKPAPHRKDRPQPLADQDLAIDSLPKARRFDIGGSFLLVSRMGEGSVDSSATHVDYAPALGFGVHGRVPILPQLQVGIYFGGARHDVTISSGGLDVPDRIASDALQALWIGSKVFPTWPMNDRVRTWASVGIGWGRFEFPEMSGRRSGVGNYVIRERGNSFVEFPIGVGGSIELIDDWLSVDFQFDVSPTIHQEGDAYLPAQVIVGGSIEHVGPLSRAPFTFTQGVGLSLLL